MSRNARGLPLLGARVPVDAVTAALQIATAALRAPIHSEDGDKACILLEERTSNAARHRCCGSTKHFGLPPWRAETHRKGSSHATQAVARGPGRVSRPQANGCAVACCLDFNQPTIHASSRMSWDISIMKFSQRYSDVSAIPSDEVPLILGPRLAVHERVLEVFPGTDWSDPTWGAWESAIGSIEFNLGDDDPIEDMMLHVRADEEVVSKIVRLCIANGWQGIDCGSGEFVEQTQDPASGLRAWSEHRDQIISLAEGRET